jgi:hypothetical protein
MFVAVGPTQRSVCLEMLRRAGLLAGTASDRGKT